MSGIDGNAVLGIIFILLSVELWMTFQAFVELFVGD